MISFIPFQVSLLAASAVSVLIGHFNGSTSIETGVPMLNDLVATSGMGGFDCGCRTWMED